MEGKINEKLIKKTNKNTGGNIQNKRCA